MTSIDPAALARALNAGKRTGQLARENARKAYARGALSPKPSRAMLDRGRAFLAPAGEFEGFSPMPDTIALGFSQGRFCPVRKVLCFAPQCGPAWCGSPDYVEGGS